MTYRKGPEYQPSIGRGKKFAVVAGLAFTAACQVEIQPTPTTEIFPTQPQATEIVPTPSPVDRIGDSMAELAQQLTATPDNREMLAYSDVGYLGRLLISFEDLPENLTDTIPSEVTESQRFISATGEKIPFGYYQDEIVRGNGKTLVLFHLQMRGEIESANPSGRLFLFSFPLEVFNPATGQLEDTGKHQFLLLGVPDQLVGGTTIVGYDNRNIESSTVNNSNWGGCNCNPTKCAGRYLSYGGSMDV